MTLKPMPVNIDPLVLQQAKARMQKLESAKNSPDKADTELKKACREFESLLTAQMLKKMRETVPKSDFFGSSEKEEIFQDMLDQEVCRNLSESSSLGLADLMYKQLSRQQGEKEPSETP